MSWKTKGNTAVITGGASGIGLATAAQLLADGMNVVIADLTREALDGASASLGSTTADRLLAVVCDVTDKAQVVALRDATIERFGVPSFLMNNAGIAINAAEPWADSDTLERTLDVNLFGVVNGCQAFIPAMLESGTPAVVVNTGSKQGITKPPMNFAYNLSKAALMTYTESVAHALRQVEGATVSAHLLVPGFVYTAMIARWFKEKPESAWTAEQTVDYMWPCLDRGDFYILCPDGETTRELDEKRIQWTADDLIKNRPALSRWHPDFEEAYKTFVS